MMLFIIFGTRGLNTTAAKGEFCCPSCGPAQPYKHVRVRRFFTLYFIPLIPLDRLGEYVECQTCHSTYNLDVLSYDPDAADREFRAQFDIAIQRVLVHMMVADGHIDQSELDAIAHIYEQLTGRTVATDELRSEAIAVQRSGGSVNDYLVSVAPSLNTPGREMVLRAACLVAAADGDIADEERGALLETATALELSRAHLNGILAEIVESGHRLQ